MIDEDDRALVAACLARDEGAFAALIAAHRPGIVRLARAQVGPHDVEDVCQDIYLRVFVRLSTFEHRSRLATWIYRVALNVIRNRQRSARRHRCDAHVSLDELCLRERFRALVHASTPASLFEATDRARRVRQAIRELPSTERRALTLWTYRDASLSTIARSTGRSMAGARRSLRRARDGVRAVWTIERSGTGRRETSVSRRPVECK
jgi:RNA polymerase sigma-70 factor (ECF subfamily)